MRELDVSRVHVLINMRNVMCCHSALMTENGVHDADVVLDCALT